MPNGNHDFDRAALEAWFVPFRKDIENFAGEHGLHIVKYYHDIPAWALSKAHPKGGTAKLDIVRSDQDDVLLGAIWFLDDEATATRWLYRPEPLRLPRSTTELTPHLEQALKDLLNAPLGAWTMESGLAV